MTEEQKDRLIAYVKQELDRERARRDEIARERGWAVHPNDMEWLDESERKVMLEVWRLGGTFRQEWLPPPTLID